MVNKYEQQLISCAKELDAINKISGSISDLTSQIIFDNNQLATKKIFNLLSSVVNSNDQNLLQLSKKFNDLLLKFYGFQKLQDIYNSSSDEQILIDKNDDGLSLNHLITRLDQLIGLQNVKNKIKDLISFQKVQQLRKSQNLIVPKNTHHLAFMGNSGTGKTTVARIVGRIYKHLGLLSSGHFIEVSRTDLIAGYQGQTALKVKKVIEKAKGGVLFIDEAYSITENEHSDSYGRECLTELTKALEDYRDDLVVIVAGYSEQMEVFFNSNPGLKSRFNTFIQFEDYTITEQIEIFNNFIIENDYSLNDKAKEKIKYAFENLFHAPSIKSNNGRFVRNLFDDLVMEHAKRVSKIHSPLETEIFEILEIDVNNVLLKHNNLNLKYL